MEVSTTLLGAYQMEQQLLDIFKANRYRAKGLISRHFSGWTECFPISLLPELEQEFVNISTG